MTVLSGAIDYWCNAFTPDRKAVWQKAIDNQGLAIKVHRPGDEFCLAEDMVARLDASGFDTVALVASDLRADASVDSFEHVACRADEVVGLAAAHPGRFVGLWSIDPTQGMAGVEQAAAMLREPWCVGLHNHTHSWDRRFDHPDFYPYYALCADRDVPFVMQAGASGGRFPSACGRPVGIDRPAIYFPTVRFVLSHTGAPWTGEAIAMATKFDNVYIGTATWPPRRWPDELDTYATGAGRTKVLYGSGFPTSGHVQAARQFADAELDADVVDAISTRNARAVFTRLPPSSLVENEES